MSPDEVIEQLGKIGVNISRATLLRYENQELIPKPSRGGGGAGGRWTDYPSETVEQAYAAWGMMHGIYGLTQINNGFFDGKPPKVSPSTIKYIRFRIDIKTLMENVTEERKTGKSYPMLDELDRLREERQSETNSQIISHSKKVKIDLPEWMKNYDEMVPHLEKFLTLVWLYEIDQAKKKLDALK